MRKSLRASRFRPALIEGEPVDLPEQSHRIEFSYVEKLELQTAPGADDI
jgi:hypothetical protein